MYFRPQQLSDRMRKLNGGWGVSSAIKCECGGSRKGAVELYLKFETAQTELLQGFGARVLSPPCNGHGRRA